MAGAPGQDEIAPPPSWRNDLLRDLPEADQRAVAAFATEVTLQPEQVLYLAGRELDHVTLVEEGLVSLHVPFVDGPRPTTVLVGPETVIGLGAVITGQPAHESACVVVGGRGLKLSRTALASLMTTRPAVALNVARVLARQAEGLQIELACRSHHTVEQRLARALLEVSRKLAAEQLRVTQEDLAATLGVQRTTVSTVAARFKRRKILTYLRSAIRIIDPVQLESLACPCARSRRVSGRDQAPAPAANR